MSRGNQKPKLWQGCLRKIKYRTYYAAEIGAKEKGEKYNCKYKIYWCKYCNCFHLATIKEK